MKEHQQVVCGHGEHQQVVCGHGEHQQVVCGHCEQLAVQKGRSKLDGGAGKVTSGGGGSVNIAESVLPQPRSASAAPAKRTPDAVKAPAAQPVRLRRNRSSSGGGSSDAGSGGGASPPPAPVAPSIISRKPSTAWTRSSAPEGGRPQSRVNWRTNEAASWPRSRAPGESPIQEIDSEQAAYVPVLPGNPEPSRGAESPGGSSSPRSTPRAADAPAAIGSRRLLPLSPDGDRVDIMPRLF
eukprot:351590-Chlamydomonas_euryale.AAC.3